MQTEDKGKLTMQNIVDITTLLSTTQQLELYHTTDGNTFYTLDYITKAIESYVTQYDGIATL